LAALKLTRANAQNIIFVASACGTLSVVAAHAILRKLYAIIDTRHAHAARRPKIRGSHRQNLCCNKKRKKFMVYDQNYFNCSTLAAPIFLNIYMIFVISL
jgi:hypothetical protein